MRRFPAFDPPEYLEWAPDEELLREYGRRVDEDPDVRSVVDGLGPAGLLDLYRDLLRTRLHDITLKRWARTGVIAKAWLGTGEEAVTVGAVAALERDRDVVLPMIRNAGALHMMGMPLAYMLKGYLASADSPSGGRDLHIGDLERGVVQPTSHMGTNVPVMAGVALAFLKKGEARVAMTWVGDGATRTAAFHEGTNFAAVQNLPLVVVIQNNQVALGTRLDRHGTGDIGRIPDAYGIPSRRCDGNHVLDVLGACRWATDRCRRGEGPAAVVAETFRMGGHATHDEREARETFPAEQFEAWGRRDPVGMYEMWLLGRGVEQEALQDVEDSVGEELRTAAEEALASRERPPEPASAEYEGTSGGGTLVGFDHRPI